VGLERGPLSLARINEELLERNSSGSGLENCICHRYDYSKKNRYSSFVVLLNRSNGNPRTFLGKGRERLNTYSPSPNSQEKPEISWFF
jgi:hypothetical protein